MLFVSAIKCLLPTSTYTMYHTSVELNAKSSHVHNSAMLYICELDELWVDCGLSAAAAIV